MRLLALAALAVTLGASAPAASQPLKVQDREVVWAKPEGRELKARIYRPSAAGDAALPLVIDVHGGAWSAFDRNAGELYHRGLAAAGFAVIAIDFRQGPEFTHPAASADVTAAVRWARLNARSLKIDPGRIGLVGSSSGGHLALLAALRPSHPGHAGTPVGGSDGAFAAHDDVDAQVDYVVALWPVADPAWRYRYAKRTGQDRLAAGHDAYFVDESAMLDASVPRLVTAGEAAALPPLLVVQPGEDSNIPVEMTLDLLRAWQNRGGRVDYAFYPGMPHAFGHRPSPATDEMIRLVADFAHRHSR